MPQTSALMAKLRPDTYNHASPPLASAFTDALSRQTRDSGGAADAYGAFSGYGSYCPEGIPVEQAIFAILAAFAASFGFLFRAITLITGRRKKRDLTSSSLSSLGNDDDSSVTFVDKMADFFWFGTFVSLSGKIHARSILRTASSSVFYPLNKTASTN